MLHDLLAITRKVYGVVFLIVFVSISQPLILNAQPLLFTDHENGRPVNKIEKKVTPYQNTLKQSEKEYLWFNRNGLTLSGRTLYWLLADLGWQQIVNINELPKESYRQYDRILTNGFLELINVDSQKSGLPLASADSRLIQAVNEDSTDQLLFSLIPEYKQINQLRAAISDYRFLSASPWPTLDLNFKPKLGQSHPQVKEIREILVRLSCLAQNAQQKNRLDIFDSVVISALKKFQRRHGLVADGELGPQTYRALQISPKQRIKQLQVNLWRWFTLPNHPPEKYLVVNIPSYQLSVMEGGEPILEMKVIVGNSKNQTPQLITQINRLTFNPSWTPTFNIIKNELIPAYRKDFLSLKRQNFQLLKGYWENVQSREIDQPNLNLMQLLQSYRLVQAPGDNNALGYYRFNIPNNHAIYLHDTPVKSLFKKEERALSHGCVRLENAGLLAKYLLTFEKSYDENMLFAAIESGKTTHIELSNPLPVYITYQTVWIDQQGELRWSPDIYDLDKKTLKIK
ncbi:MAG: murein L,D-transpeptidase YcbB/YkuD [Psychromonas sp.]|jgi:murein L,D-transpeptidase YcbB/YkuD|uniref:L,D-transpeptidase family protein n=1 Tax=Psychromonas sp. TaxID=1884585 RepID=UPI0039E4BC2F